MITTTPKPARNRGRRIRLGIAGCGLCRYPSLEEMVKDDKIEAVFVATDAPNRAQHCLIVLEHGNIFYTEIALLRTSEVGAARMATSARSSSPPFSRSAALRLTSTWR